MIKSSDDLDLDLDLNRRFGCTENKMLNGLFAQLIFNSTIMKICQGFHNRHTWLKNVNSKLKNNALNVKIFETLCNLCTYNLF